MRCTSWPSYRYVVITQYSSIVEPSPPNSFCMQASIEYVNYLEKCIGDLKHANTERDSSATPAASPSWRPAPPPVSHDHLASDSSAYSVSPDLDPLQNHASTNPSPMESPQDYGSRASFDIIPMVLPSPSLPMPGHHNNNDNNNNHHNNINTNQASHHQVRTHGMSTATTTAASTTPSPMILPQQAVSFSTNTLNHRPDWGGDSNLDHEATTALLMLNNDRRQPQASANPPRWQEMSNDGEQRKFGISVHDLLSH